MSWNCRNAPLFPSGCFLSALRAWDRNPQKWAKGQAAVWDRLRGILGLPTVEQVAYRKNGRWWRLTLRKWEEQKLQGGREHFVEVEERLLRVVAGEGGQVQMT